MVAMFGNIGTSQDSMPPNAGQASGRCSDPRMGEEGR
jgi:hypothetical protein